MSTIKVFGGELNNLYDSIKWEQPGYWQYTAGRCHKDRKGYRPWRSKKQKDLKQELFYPAPIFEEEIDYSTIYEEDYE
jgi:hypothetical protein